MAAAAPAAGATDTEVRVSVAVRIRPKLDSLGEKYDMDLCRKIDDETVLAIGYTNGVVDGIVTQEGWHRQ